MYIRKLNEKDIFEHEKIASQSFVFPADFKSLKSLPSDNMYGAFSDNDRLMADLEVGHKECYFNRNLLSCSAVGGVACKPEYRNKGAVSALMNYVNENSGDDIAILYPFSTAYYSRFGYSCVGKKQSFIISLDAFSSLKRNTNVELFEGGNSSLLDLYNKCAPEYSLCFKRDDLSYFDSDPYRSLIYTYLCKDNDNNYTGYVTFSLDRQNKLISVIELFYLDSDALISVLGFLINYNGNYDRIEFQCVSGYSRILDFASEIKPVSVKSTYAGQVRILNMFNVLKCLNSDIVFDFTLLTKEDNRGYAIHVTPDGSDVSVVDNINFDFDIVCSINSASKLIFDGIISYKDADYIPGIVTFKKKTELLYVFKKRDCFFIDGF